MKAYRRDGTPVDLPDHEAAAAYLRGEIGLPADARVPVRDARGEYGTLPAAQLRSGVEHAGFQIATAGEVDRAARDRTAVVDSATIAGAAGVARGLTYGLSDVAAVEVGGDPARRAMQEARVEHPTLSTVSEVAGAALPLILSRGRGRVGAVSRAAPTSIVARAGAAAEAATARALGAEAATVGGRIAQRAVPLAVGGAVEGLAYGAGHQLSEDVLGGRDVTAERLLAGAGRGALFGGIAGGSIGVIGRGAVEAYGAASKSASGLLRRALPAVDDAAGGIAQRVGEAGRGSERFLDAMELATGVRYPDLATAVKEAGYARLLKSTGGLTKEMRALEGLRQGRGNVYTRAAEMVADDIPQIVGRRGVKYSRMHMQDGVRELQTRIGREFDAIEEAAERIARESGRGAVYRPDMARITAQIRRDVVDDFASQLGGDKAAKAVADVLDEAVKKFPEPSLAEARKMRVWIDKNLVKRDAFGKVKDDSRNRAFAKVRSIFEGENERVVASITRDLGDDAAGNLAARYKQAKLDHAAVTWLDDAVQRGIDAEKANRSFSLGDHILGGVGAVVGATANPVLALPGMAIGGVVSHVIRKRGDQALGHAMLDAAARMSGSPRDAAIAAVRRTSDSTAARVVSASRAWTSRMTGGAARMAPRAAAMRSSDEERRARAASVVTHTRAAVADPRAVVTRVATMAGPLAEHAPGAYAEITSTAVRAYAEMARVIPPPPPRDTLLAHTQPERLTPSQVDRIVRAADAIEDPVAVLDAAASGDATPEQIDIIQRVYPTLMADVRTTLADAIAGGGIDPSYRDRVMLSLIFGVPADESLTPESIAMSQTTYMRSQSEQSAPPRRPIDIAASTRTPDHLAQAGGRFA